MTTHEGFSDIHVSSPWTGWIYNFFTWLFNGLIKRKVRETSRLSTLWPLSPRSLSILSVLITVQVESTVEEAIAAIVSDVIDPALQAMPYMLDVIGDVDVSDALLADMAASASDASLLYDGAFQCDAELPCHDDLIAVRRVLSE